MMNKDFLKRLGYYLVGLSIGIVFLTFFFKKKSEETGVSFCYLPNCRTLKDIRSKQMYYSNEAKKQIAELQLDSLDIKFVLTEGVVDFGNSDTKSTPCKMYLVNSEIKEKEISFTMKNCKDKVTLQEINLK